MRSLGLGREDGEVLIPKRPSEDSLARGVFMAPQCPRAPPRTYLGSQSPCRILSEALYRILKTLNPKPLNPKPLYAEACRMGCRSRGCPFPAARASFGDAEIPLLGDFSFGGFSGSWLNFRALQGLTIQLSVFGPGLASCAGPCQSDSQVTMWRKPRSPRLRLVNRTMP